MNVTYKGYTGLLKTDTEEGIVFGRVLNIRDVVTFEGRTVEEAKQAFEDSVDDYLELLQTISPKALESLRKGKEQAASGDLHDLGSFAEFADLEIED